MLSGRDGLAGTDGGALVVVGAAAGRAGGRSWGPGGIQQAWSGTVVAARCHQSTNATAQPSRIPRQLASRENVDELRRKQRRTAHAELAEPRHAATRTVSRAPAGSREQGAITEPQRPELEPAPLRRRPQQQQQQQQQARAQPKT